MGVGVVFPNNGENIVTTEKMENCLFVQNEYAYVLL